MDRNNTDEKRSNQFRQGSEGGIMLGHSRCLFSGAGSRVSLRRLGLFALGLSLSALISVPASGDLSTLSINDPAVAVVGDGPTEAEVADLIAAIEQLKQESQITTQSDSNTANDNASQPNGAGWFTVEAEPVSIDANRLYQQQQANSPSVQATLATRTELSGNLSTTSANVFVATQSASHLSTTSGGSGSANDIDPESEIAILARGLMAGLNPSASAEAAHEVALRMYQYVTNHIDYAPYYGSLKGATQTLLDRAGNDFDQASLLVELFRLAGFDAKYVHGVMGMPAAGDAQQRDLEHWLDMSAQQAAKMLIDTGVPIVFFVEDNYLQLERVWVRLSLPDGSSYDLDPSFKIYDSTPGINLEAATGLDLGALKNSAGGTVSIDFVHDQSYAGLSSYLNGLSSDLSNYLKSLH